MGRLEQDLERIKELAVKEQKIHDRIRDVKNDEQIISGLKVGEILPEGYEELFNLEMDDPDLEMTVRSYVKSNGKYGTLPSIKKIENEEIGTFLPWMYMDGPYTFEISGRQKREIMRSFVKELLVIYGVSEELVEEIASRGW